MESFSIQYPWWYIFLCLALAGGLTWLLYGRSREFEEQPLWLQRVLPVLRFLAVFLILFLLLSPVLKYFSQELRKPLVIFAQDDSASLPVNWPEASRQSYAAACKQLEDKLKGDFEFTPLSFGEEVRPGFSFQYAQRATDMSQMIRDINDSYANQQIAAIILASDGIYNKGANPLYLPLKSQAPVFTVALGDTTLHKDLLIRNVLHNKIAYLGDKINLQADISAHDCGGQKTRFKVTRVEGKGQASLLDEPVTIGTNRFFLTREIQLGADKPGILHLRISAEVVGGETNRANNVRDVYIEVLDAREKVLILADAPHPDVSALRNAILSNRNYQVTTAMIADFREPVKDYDIVILHQLPSRNHSASQVLEQLNARGIPRWFIGGLQTDYARLNQAQNLLQVNSGLNSMNDVQALVSPAFSLFTVSETLRKELPLFNPLQAPFGEFKLNANAQAMLLQKIGKVETRYPLLVFGEQNGNRTAVLAAEGLYHWQLFNFLQYRNHDIFREFISSVMQYLSIKDDKRKFRVYPQKNIFAENEPVVFNGELYNENYQLVNDPDVNLVLRNASGKEYLYTMNKSGNSYQLNAGFFPPGDYTYSAQANFNNVLQKSQGEFKVQSIQVEMYETVANHALLRQLASATGGKMLYQDQLQELESLIRTLPSAKPVLYSTHQNRNLIYFKWIFFLIGFFLFLEWFLRRYFGKY